MGNRARGITRARAENRVNAGNVASNATRSSRLSHCRVLLLAVLPRSRTRSPAIEMHARASSMLKRYLQSKPTGTDDNLMKSEANIIFRNPPQRYK